MSRVPITNLFNAYDLQVNPHDPDKIGSQEVVNYCEARFRVALQAMMGRSDKDQKWMYKILYQEMVFSITLSWLCLLLITLSHFRSYVSLTLVWQPRSANRLTSQSL
jgi:hypothetical protein